MEDRGIAISERADELLAALDSAIGGLREIALYRLSETDLLGLARRVEAASHSVGGVGVRVAGEVAERRIAQTLSSRSPAHLLHETLHITVAQARSRRDRDRRPAPRRSLGRRNPARTPRTARRGRRRCLGR